MTLKLIEIKNRQRKANPYSQNNPLLLVNNKKLNKKCYEYGLIHKPIFLWNQKHTARLNVALFLNNWLLS